MRLRYVKNGKEIVDNNPDIVIQNPEDYKGVWKDKKFNNKNSKLSLEIGCGKGQFLSLNAIKNPNDSFIGIEMMTSVICRAVQKINDQELTNVLLLNKDGANILDYFSENEIDYLYINFPDPWPKARHEKRRLTNPTFLEKYKQILKDDGIFRFRTDNYDLYEYSLETIPKFLKDGYSFGVVQYSEDEIMTEFETKFRNAGNPIYEIKGQFK